MFCFFSKRLKEMPNDASRPVKTVIICCLEHRSINWLQTAHKPGQARKGSYYWSSNLDLLPACAKADPGIWKGKRLIITYCKLQSEIIIFTWHSRVLSKPFTFDHAMTKNAFFLCLTEENRNKQLILSPDVFGFKPEFPKIWRGERRNVGLICAVAYQWTGPGVGDTAQPVPAHVEHTQRLQTVHDGRGQTGQAVLRHIQLLQLTEADPVCTWQTQAQHKGHLSIATKQSVSFVTGNYFTSCEKVNEFC